MISFRPAKMISAEPRGSDPSAYEQARLALFQVARSEGAHLRGVDLAFLVRQKPRIPSSTFARKGRKAIIGTLGRGGLGDWCEIAIDSQAGPRRELLEKLLGRIASRDDVVLAKPELPRWIWEKLEEADYFCEVPPESAQERRSRKRRSQYFGWAAETLSEARDYWTKRPEDARPTIGLLPTGDGRITAPSLVLVDVDYQWMPLSEVGAHGRTGGVQLLARDPIFFVEKEHRQIYKLLLWRLVGVDEVRKIWGRLAAERAREDVPSLMVKATPVQSNRE